MTCVYVKWVWISFSKVSSDMRVRGKYMYGFKQARLFVTLVFMILYYIRTLALCSYFLCFAVDSFVNNIDAIGL